MYLERVLSAVRALVARELVKRGYSVNETAKILRLTPAAVSMYLSGKRGGNLVDKLEKDERVMSVVRSHCDVIEDIVKRGGGESVDLTEIAKIVTGIITQKKTDVTIEEVIRGRIKIEQETATRAMTFSYKSRNPLVRSLFMQIAADSLRHAEILTAILDYLTGRLKADDLDISSDELETLAGEEYSMREGIAELYNMGDPIVRALILSIELDEQKHYQLVKSLQIAARR